MKSTNIIIRIEQSNEQIIAGTKKVVGLIRAKYLVQIIDHLNLEANPRSSKTGAVTDAIQDSIKSNSSLLPFKSKGILIACSQYEVLDRGRFMLSPSNPEIEGILDGGHNTLAVGMYILKHAMEYKELPFPRGQKTWAQFKEMWEENRGAVTEYLEYVRNSEVEPENLNFFIPIELLVPTDPHNKLVTEAFKNDLLEICAARNNNVQLQESAKANQEGFFDDLRSLMEKQNPTLCDRIEWKTNDGGDIKIQNLVALAWIPLNLMNPVKDADGKVVEPVAPNKLYSSKGACLSQFVRFMSSPEVTSEQSHDYKKELKNTEVISAFRLAVQIPEIYDYIYKNFQTQYNSAGGSYGRIDAVKTLNNKAKTKVTPFTNEPVETLNPEGFVMPLVYGLSALIDKKEESDGSYSYSWKVDPYEFLDKNFNKIFTRYINIFPLCAWDPQKVGKTPQSYLNIVDTFNLILANMI